MKFANAVDYRGQRRGFPEYGDQTYLVVNQTGLLKKQGRENPADEIVELMLEYGLEVPSEQPLRLTMTVKLMIDTSVPASMAVPGGPRAERGRRATNP